MRIVIAGAGEVGKHVAKMLAYEEQDIILMDSDPKRLQDIGSKEEILTLEGNPLMLSDLETASVDGADLFVCVTPDEATNILACNLAKRVGASFTIARINNHEYLQPELIDTFKDMGVDHMIYPEELAAQDIANSTRYPWVRQYLELFNGALVLIGVKVREGAPIVDKYLYELPMGEQGDKFYHVVAIKRDLETIIPSGNTRIEHNDLVFFTCLTHKITEIRELTGKVDHRVHKLVIMGASRVAQRAIAKLPSDIHISLIEQNKDKCMRLVEDMPSNVSIYHGDGRDPEILKEVGLEDTDGFVALTENSETNILACLAARRWGVFKTIAQEENIDYIPLAHRLDIGALVNKKLMTAGHIYRMLLGQREGSVVCLSQASNAEVAEFIVKRDSNIVGQCIRELSLPKNMTFGGMLRNGVPQIIDGNTIIEPYDHIVVFYHNVALNKLKKLFS